MMGEAMRKWLAMRIGRLGAKLMTWSYVEQAKLKGWTPEQVRATRQIAMREENCIWDTIRGQILWNKSETEAVNARLARRYDPGMALTEVANRAIAARQATRAQAPNPEGHTGAPLTEKQLAALKFQKEYLDRAVKNS